MPEVNLESSLYWTMTSFTGGFLNYCYKGSTAGGPRPGRNGVPAGCIRNRGLRMRSESAMNGHRLNNQDTYNAARAAAPIGFLVDRTGANFNSVLNIIYLADIRPEAPNA